MKNTTLRDAATLCLALALAGCQTQQPTADTRAQAFAASTATITVRPGYSSGGVRQLMTTVTPYTQASISHMEVKLFTWDGTTEALVALVDLNAAQLGQTITFGNLAHNTTYRVRAYAFKAAGTNSADQISVDASSYVDIAVGENDAPPLGNLVVTLKDQTFSGSASSSGLTVNTGAVVHTGSESITIEAPPAFGTTIETYNIGQIAYGGLAVGHDGSVWIGKTTSSNDRSLARIKTDGTIVHIPGYFLNPEVDSLGNVWAANPGGTVSKFTGEGVLVGTYAAGSNPSGVGIDAQDNVWVANYNVSGTVTKLSSAGAQLGTFNVGKYPHDVTFDNASNAWVENVGDGSITKLSNTGTFVSNFLVKSPSGGGPQDVAFDSDGFAWVTGVDDDELWPAFRKVNSSGVTVGQFRLNTDSVGIAIASNGTKYITSESGRSLMKVSPAGAIVGQVTVDWPSYGVGIGIDGSVYVANYEPGIVYKLAP